MPSRIPDWKFNLSNQTNDKLMRRTLAVITIWQLATQSQGGRELLLQVKMSTKQETGGNFMQEMDR